MYIKKLRWLACQQITTDDQCFHLMYVKSRRESIRVMNKALKIANLGLNIPIKLNETLIDSSIVFIRLHGPSEASLAKLLLIGYG